MSNYTTWRTANINKFILATKLFTTLTFLGFGLVQIFINHSPWWGLFDLSLMLVWFVWAQSIGTELVGLDRALVDWQCVADGLRDENALITAERDKEFYALLEAKKTIAHLEKQYKDLKRTLPSTHAFNVYCNGVNNGVNEHAHRLSPLTDPEYFTQSECQWAKWVAGRGLANDTWPRPSRAAVRVS